MTARKVVILIIVLAMSLLLLAVAEEGSQGEAPVTEDGSNGLYTAEQADRGRTAYFSECAECHGLALNGGMGPALKGDAFLDNWGSRSIVAFHDYIHDNMPLGRGGGLDDQTYVDIVAHLLRELGHPEGDNELTLDGEGLAEVTVRPDSE